MLASGLPVDSSGGVTVQLSSTQASIGGYVASLSVNPQASAGFILDQSRPLRAREGSATVVDLPAGISFNHAIYLPIILSGPLIFW